MPIRLKSKNLFLILVALGFFASIFIGNVGLASTVDIENFDSYPVGDLSDNGNWVGSNTCYNRLTKRKILVKNYSGHAVSAPNYIGLQFLDSVGTTATGFGCSYYENKDVLLLNPDEIIFTYNVKINDIVEGRFEIALFGAYDELIANIAKIPQQEILALYTPREGVSESMHDGSIKISPLSDYTSNNEYFKLVIVLNQKDKIVSVKINDSAAVSAPYLAYSNYERFRLTIHDRSTPIYFDDISVEYKSVSEKKKDPIIIVPGIMGSYLNDAESGDEVWPNIPKMLLPGDDDYLDDLILSLNGEPKDNNIVSGDIIRKISDNDFFEGLITELENNGYEEGVNLFVFSYDWRLDIGYLAGIGASNNSNTLNNKINEILNVTGAEKVDLIAHSMGGLVVKKYMQTFGTEKIDKFIDLATPHLGAPKAAKILLYGDDMDLKLHGLGLNQERVKIISQNMPAVYGLLPSEKYFEENNFYLADIFDLDKNNIKGNLNFSETAELLSNTGRNSQLIVSAANLHNEIDNYSPEANGIKTYNFVGCGEATIGKIYLLNKEKSGGNEYGLRYISGDGTVPMRSAEHLETSSEFYIKEANHAKIPSNNNAKDLIVSILNDNLDSFNFLNYPNLSEDSDSCSLNGVQISYHSPIDLHIYDEFGNHAGPNENGDIEVNIPGVQYDIIDNNKFAFLPEGGSYTIKGRATDIGTFNARVEKIENGEYTETIYFNEIPLTSINSNVQLNLDKQLMDYNGIVFQADSDGDGIFENDIAPSSVLNEAENDDLKKPITNLAVIGEKENEDSEYYFDSVLVELTAEDNENGVGILKTEYSLDNGFNWQIYSEPLLLSIPRLSTTTEEIYIIKYSSVDKAGNREEEKEEIIKIKKLIAIDFLISDIEELYNQGEIKSKIAKNKLIKDLEWINKYIKKNNKKDGKRLELSERIKKICEKMKHKEKCERIVSFISDRKEFGPDNLNGRIIKIKIKQLLKLMDFYHEKQWVSELGYDIIQMELNYLINNIS